MSIAITRYVNITSAVGGASAVAQRSLVARIFTSSFLVPPRSSVSFLDAESVGDYFGTSSEEYLRAVFYFSFISKIVTTPASIQFARWTNTAVAPSVASAPANVPVDVATWAAISDGSLGITIGGFVATFTSISFSGVTDLAGVAAAIQTKIRLNANANFSTATVTYDSTNGFVFTGGAVGTGANLLDISVQAGSTGTNITGLSYLGWLPAATYDANGFYSAGALTSPGSAVETVTQALQYSATTSNNFGSFLFLNNLSLSLANAILAAAWNITQNNTYLFCAPVTSSNYAAWTDDTMGLGLYAGTALTLSGNTVALTGITTNSSAQITGVTPLSSIAVGMPVTAAAGIPAGSIVSAINTSTGAITISNAATASGSRALTFTLNQYPEQIPMMVLAATDYTLPNSAQNYMYQGPFTGLSPLVSDDASANLYDAAGVNYYGNTQQSGQALNFYQTGVLQGTTNSPLNMTAFTNEMWLKDAITVQIMNLFLGLSQVPANSQGRGLLLTAIQDPINRAVLNGAISVNKTLTNTQKQFIGSVTNDNSAWYQVQDIGYWVDCEIVPPVSPATAYTAAYTLVYSKDDVINFVSGRDILI